MGGLSKKAFQFDKIVREENSPFIKIDAGNLLFKHPQLSVKQEEQEKVTAYGIIKSYNLMGYDAVGVSQNDLIAGVPFLKGIVNASNFPWLSANLVHKTSNTPLFTSSIVITKGNLKIGITGLTSPKTSTLFNDAAKINILPWQKVLTKIIAELAPKCDLIVLLSNLTATDNRQISKLFPAIRIIIQSGISAINLAPTLVNDTLICQTGKQGKQIGVMKVEWRGGKWGSKKPEQLQYKKNVLDRILWQLSKYQQYKNPLEELKKIPNKLSAYQRLLAKKEQTKKEINALSKEVAASVSNEEPSTQTNRFIAMQTSLPDHQGIVRIVDETNRQINEIGKKLIANRSEIESPYIGSEKCGTCHKSQLRIWRTSQHARAYTTLLNKKQHYNLDCLPCHITGNSDMDQGDALNLKKELHGVGCENCHGPGRKHALEPEKDKLRTSPGAAICLKCHTADHDNYFDYDKNIKIIKH